MKTLLFHKKQILAIAFLVGCLLPCYAQKKINALPLRLNFSIPKTLSNQGYKRTFNGVFDIGLSFGYGYRNFNIGGFFRTMQFEIPSQYAIRVKMLQGIQNTGIRFGYDYPFGDDKFLITSGIAVGYNWIKYSRIVSTKPVNPNATGINISPSLGLQYLIEKGFGFGLEFTYNNISYVFDPYAVNLDAYRSYAKDDLSKKTGIFSFGFSVYYNFLVKSDDNEDL